MTVEYLAGKRVKGLSTERLGSRTLSNIGISTSGLKAYYNFEQTSGNLINQAIVANGYTDGLGSSADGTPINGVTQTISGKTNNAYDFDGTNDYVTLGNNFTSFQTGNISISFWVKFDTASGNGNMGIITKDFTSHSNPYRSVSISLAAGLLLWLNDGGSWTGSQITIISGSVPTDVWKHIVITRSGNTWTAYVDSVSVATVVANPTFYSTDWEIGRGRNLDYFNGKIDEVSFWSRALTTNEIQTLYSDGSLLTNIQNATVFEETDTNKSYIWNSSTSTWTQF